MAKKAVVSVAGIKLGWVGIILVAAIVATVILPSLGYPIEGLPSFAITGTGNDVTPAPTPPVPVECESTTTPAVTYTILDSIKNGTDLTSQYDQNVYINGVSASNAVAGTAIAANPGDKLTVYFMNNGTHDVYGFIEEYTVPCQETVNLTTTRGMQDGSLTTTVYQSDDVTANTASAVETLGAGASAEGRIRIKEATDDGYWSTTETGQMFLLVTDVNKTVFDEFEVTSTSPAVSFSAVSVPPSHTTQDTTNHLLSVAYEIDGSNLVDLDKIDVYFIANALGATQNPGTDSNLLFTIMDKELYKNANTGAWMVDYYNAVDNTDLGETNATDIYHVG